MIRLRSQRRHMLHHLKKETNRKHSYQTIKLRVLLTNRQSYLANLDSRGKLSAVFKDFEDMLLEIIVFIYSFRLPEIYPVAI